MKTDTVWLKPPDGGPPQEVPATIEALSPLMKDGWTQCAPPEAAGEVN